ncbi:exosortase [Altererythrobacter atlanticus]|uniref:Transmembrane exosortase n=1 Tax=Croceibacterium atlanticum TaxID=1267766 RepID=A0A0F7KVL5_9SPHN|nr:exosortase/archaeosortase family protein [Croceibacterium atlanticum]AKH42810.1 Transmembrane exosortase [Croceibacterium atlanticum]MBB5731590.1 exosortase [Croceibacterium atlanticum]
MPAARRHILLWLCCALFLLPAILMLSAQSWQSEAGSLAPLVLCLGGWTLWQVCRNNRDEARPGSLSIWAACMVAIALAYLFASTIEMAALAALAAWAGGTITFYLFLGPVMLRRCAFPLLFLALAIPAPYAVSASVNGWLRGWLSVWSVDMARALGLDAVLDQGKIYVEQYVLVVENACAGMSSTISLVAIGLLFAFWIHGGGWMRTAAMAALAVPIAILANVLRVVVLILLVSEQGSRILATGIHPLSGVLSFTLALALLLLAFWIVDLPRKIGGRGVSRTAGN